MVKLDFAHLGSRGSCSILHSRAVCPPPTLPSLPSGSRTLAGTETGAYWWCDFSSPVAIVKLDVSVTFHLIRYVPRRGGEWLVSAIIQNVLHRRKLTRCIS